MFEVKPYKVMIRDFHKIVNNLHVLFNDGDNDVLYTGTNGFGNRILGAIVGEDDDNNFVRYFHIVVSDEQYTGFINRQTSLRAIIEESDTVFIIDKTHGGKEISVNLIPIIDIPSEFLPLANSFCPDFIKDPSLKYAVSLKGKISDLHKATPEELAQVSAKFSDFIRTSTEFVNDLELSRRVYIEALKAGSFQINFDLEVSELQQLSMFTVSLDNLGTYLSSYFNYVFAKLPSEENGIFKESEIVSTDFRKLESTLNKVYEERHIVPQQNLEHKIIDIISYSVENLKGMDFENFDKIEFINYEKSGNELPMGLIDKGFIPSIESKIFRPESLEKEDIIELDQIPTKYSVQVYNFNTQTGNGGAYLATGEDKIEKISLHARGRTNYENTAFTKSLDEGKIVTIEGFATRVNGRIKVIQVQLQ